MEKEVRICPFPGLRPFTEQEAIFFKGRDSHVKQVINQLEEKKFMMITGVSGEGKSSMVYAGVIPTAKAGFFKAEYNNWLFIDFKPGRTPLTNMAKALSVKLNYEIDYVINELQFGYSSLVNLYTSSDFYFDKNTEKISSSLEEKKIFKKKANLFILVDQFEEFFTHSENYQDEKISLDAELVVNLLLETIRISKERNLPIYVVCTMRSDYISKCSLFRDLPDFIGYSQFFVPRLSRRDIQQVIEEPARLNGEHISQGLIELLINELSEEVDQLPILQHTLNRVWHIAQERKESMDLIHLALLNGIPYDYLTEQDQKIIKEEKRDEVSQNKFAHISNVLNNHADELYNNSPDYFFKNSLLNENNTITKQEILNIVKQVFQCLTRIDENKTVRRSMPLIEITNILNLSNVSSDLIVQIIDIFRELNNALISPYITSNSVKLDENSILNISHESLIRNWKRLNLWAIEENTKWTIYLDLKSQFDKWIENEKSEGYLLPVGSLEYFEKRYQESKPNKYWLSKYFTQIEPYENRLEHCKIIIQNLNDFLSSSRKQIDKKVQNELRIKKLIIGATVFVFIILSGFSLWALKERQFANEQKQVAEKQTEKALVAKKIAEEANKLAIIEKENAKKNEQAAIVSNKKAALAKDEALREKQAAENQRTIAEQQREIAQEEKSLAEEERKKADIQKKIAESAKENEVKLSRLNLAKRLALQSLSIKDNYPLKSLLAGQAYMFNLANGGIEKESIIYEALLSAWLISMGNSNIISKLKSEQKSMALINIGEKLISAGNDGVINKWNIDDFFKSSSVQLNIDNMDAINTIFYEKKGKELVIGHDDYSLSVWSVSNNRMIQKLVNHKGLIRTVAFSNNTKFMATGGKDKTIIIWEKKNEMYQEVNQIATNSEVKSLLYLSHEKKLISVTDSGEIRKWDTSTLLYEKIYKGENEKVFSLQYIHSQNKLVAGFQNGKVRIFDLNQPNFSFIELNNHQAKVTDILLNRDESILVTNSADKTINLYSIENLDWMPISIKDHNAWVRSLIIDNKNRLIASCSDNTLRYWETDPKEIYKKLEEESERNLTNEEWDEFIGEEINYQLTYQK